MSELEVKKREGRLEIFPDKEPCVTYEFRSRPDYYDRTDLRLYLSFPLEGRMFEANTEKVMAAVEASLKQHFKEPVAAMTADLEKVMNV
jgi:hypothetical protein